MAELDELKAVVAQVIEAVNSRNLEAFSETLHDDVAFFLPRAPFALDGKAAVREGYRSLFANCEELMTRLINPQYRVVGTAGIVWGHLAVSIKPKDGPLTSSFLRFTWSFVKSNEKWRRVAVHLSSIPSGN
ncbi:MAG: nuclear transport factor 2 family protein [Candidatus Binatia bacterium]